MSEEAQKRERSLNVSVEERDVGVYLAWLEKTLGPCQKEPDVPEAENMSFYTIHETGQQDPVGLLVTEKMNPLDLSVAFRGAGETSRVPPDPVRDVQPIPLTWLRFSPPPLRWATSVDLGRQLSRELGVDVLCDPGARYPMLSP